MKRVAAALLLFGAFFFATPAPEPRWTLCLFHWLTGLNCPLCGLTRGMCALAKGHWHEAIGFNALTPLAAAMLIALFWRHSWRDRLWSAGIAAFGAYGIWRVL